MTDATFLSNHLLIAMPSLKDPTFNRSVTYICEHNQYGAVGIIINRPTNTPLSYILNHLKITADNQKIKEIPLLYGGPVQQSQGFIIHRPIGDWRSTLEVTEEIAITTSQDILEAIAHGKGPDDVLIALGYAGWEAEQLEQEIRDNSWLSCPATPELLFNIPFSERWKISASLLGVDFNQLSNEIGHA
jgi:putative transcriptional regulator